MTSHQGKHPHRTTRWLIAAVALCFVGAMATNAAAQVTTTPIFQVQEDWQLVVNAPDSALDAPQITTVISPDNMVTAYCAFDINFHSQPSYSAGGLQMHIWDPATPIIYSNLQHSGNLVNSGETITWTTQMSLDQSGNLSFHVLNGQSVTWGKFGGTGYSTVTYSGTTLANLNGYDPSVTLNNSGVGFASNLVTNLTLLAARAYDVNGNLVWSETTPQNVHPQN